MWHSRLLLFALSLGLVPVAFGDDTFCFPTGNCYTVKTAMLTFDKANSTCGTKGFLASMKTQQENRELSNIVTQLQNQRNISSFWLGLYLPRCITSAKRLYGYVWVSGEDTTDFAGWKTIPKPSCTTKKRCVILESKQITSNIRPSAVTLVWKSVKCERNVSSICRSGESRHISATKDTKLATQSSTDPYRTHTLLTDQYTTYTSVTTQHTEMPSFTTQVNVTCGPLSRNVTYACKITISYVCNATDCLCGNVNDSRVLYKHRTCKDLINMSCLQQCIKSMNISCSCDDPHTPCDGEQCTTNLSVSSKPPVLPSTVMHSASSTSAPTSEDDNLLDRLVIPLILGLVALGILIMLVWGGLQMCIRKRKPKRRKSIIPAPPDAIDTDSTDHSSSEDEEEDDEEEESQDRTEDP